VSATAPAQAAPAPRVLRPQRGPQELFLSTHADVAIYGGGAGSGKSFALLLEPLRYMRTVNGFGAVVFRRTSPQITNEGGLWDESYLIYPALGAVPKESTLEWYFPPHGNRLRFAHMEHEKNRFDWQGSQIPFIGFDELTGFTEEQFFYMFSRSRSTCGVRPYIRATTNPDADSWVAELITWWIDQDTGFPIPARAGQLRWFIRVEGTLVWADTPEELAVLHPDIPPKSMTFVPALVHDNPALLSRDPSYLANLYALPPVERARLLGGNWKIRPEAGLVFNRGWFRIVDAVATDVIARIRYWDKAGTEGGGSYSAGVRMARTEQGLYFVEDVVRGQWSSARRNEVIKQTAQTDGLGCAIWSEQEPGSGGKESAEATIRMLAGWNVHAERPTGDKVTRAQPLSAQAEVGNVLLVQGAWNKAFLDELHGFPTGPQDDQVDGASGAFNKLAGAIVVPPFDESELQGEIPDDEFGGSFL